MASLRNSILCQGNFLALCSDPNTIGRNSGIVWAMVQVFTLLFTMVLVFTLLWDTKQSNNCQMSGLVGNTFAFFMFNGEEFVSTKVAQESNSGARWILELPGSDDGWSRPPHRHWRRSGSPPNFEVCQPRPRIDAFFSSDSSSTF